MHVSRQWSCMYTDIPVLASIAAACVLILETSSLLLPESTVTFIDMKAMDNDLARNACFQSSPGYVAHLTSMHDPFTLNMYCNTVLSGTSCKLCADGTCLYNVL